MPRPRKSSTAAPASGIGHPASAVDPEAAGAIERALGRQQRDPWRVPQTATQAAAAFGIDPKTMIKKLREAGLEIGQNKTYPLAEVVRAMIGDLEYERTRLTRSDANIREMEEREKRGELISREQVNTLLRDILLTIQQNLHNLPSELAVLVNPTDPQLAREQASAWLDRKLPVIREKILELKADDASLGARLRAMIGRMEALRTLLREMPVALSHDLPQRATPNALRVRLADWVETVAMPATMEPEKEEAVVKKTGKKKG